MISRSTPAATGLSAPTRVGGLAHAGLFVSALLLVTFTAGNNNLLPIVVGLLMLWAIYPNGIKRLVHPRWVLIFTLFFSLNVLFGPGEKDVWIWGLPLSSANMISGLAMILRALVILIAADGLTTSIDITEVAALFERIGFSGLGFSLGVAVNLIPNISESVTATWHSLRMRGGLRSQWLRGFQLFILTVLSNSLRRSEEIVLAAEARAFSPTRTRKLHFHIGRLDWLIVALSFAGLIVLLLFR
jgi:energy-coupling factor transporter transmembrane protein EcfT